MTDMTRVGDMAHLEALKLQIRFAQSRLARLQMQAVTGRRVQAPSDDPPAASRAVSLKLDLENTEQLVSSVNQARTWLGASEEGLGTVQRILADARVLTLQAASDSQSAESRATLALEIDHLIEELAETSAGRESGGYLFSGTRLDVPPYTFTRDADGRIDGVVVEPNIDGDVERLVDRDLRVKVNVSAGDVFGVGDPTRVDLFQVLVDVRDALLADDGAQAAALVDDLEAGEDQVIGEASALGAVTGRLDGLIDRLDRRDLTLNQELSEAEDADLAATLIDLAHQESVLAVALEITARTARLSLFDFI